MENVNVIYKKIFEDNVKNQKQAYQRFKQNFDRREDMKNENSSHHGIPQVDPLYNLYSNGNK